MQLELLDSQYPEPVVCKQPPRPSHPSKYIAYTIPMRIYVISDNGHSATVGEDRHLTGLGHGFCTDNAGDIQQSHAE